MTRLPALPRFPLSAAAAAAAAALVAGCATPPAPTAAGGAAATAAAPAAVATKPAAPAPAPAAAPAAPGAGGAAAPPASATPPAGVIAGANVPGATPAGPPLRPFADVVRDATRSDGFVPVWRKDNQVWLEITPQMLGKPMLMSVNIAQSVGERGLYGSQMGPRWMVEFRRVGNQFQVVAKQMGFRAPRDAAMARTVSQSFSDSLVGSGPVLSSPHPERKSFLVDAAFLLGDTAGYSTRLEIAYRMPFAPDRPNSYFESARAEAELTTLSAKVHYAVPRIAAPPLLPPGAPAPPLPPPPATLPDARSLFIGYVYNFRALPATPMAARRVDNRVGHFTQAFTDVSDDLTPTPRVHNIIRWRLEKKDPTAAMSEPVKPITYWLDKNIPARYRASVTAGILEWNKAFERIGFKNAVVARQQGDDDTWDNMDAGHASIRWFTGADVGFAIGPSNADPRSGEILDADIGMSDDFGRGARRAAREDMAMLSGGEAPAWRSAWQAAWQQMSGEQAYCTYAADGAAEMDFALDLLAARGDLPPDSPEADAMAQAYVKDTIMHEVGHTLGLKHNFKASVAVTSSQLGDREFVARNGLATSVMDYNPFNLPLAGEPKRELNMTTLGEYDYWAIEYAYKPIEPAAEAAELRRIAERVRTDPRLTFADDADAGTAVDGIDPYANRFDLGDDPLAYYARRMALTRELWQRMQERGVQPGDDSLRLRRSLNEGLRQLSRVPPLAAKYVGGMHTERDTVGTGKPGYKPVAPAQQRKALAFLNEQVFGVEAFRFKPEFLAAMTPDFNEWNRGGPVSVPQIVLQLQGATLDRLMDPGTARRLLELPSYLPEAERKTALSLAEVQATVQGAVWSELKSGRDIDPMRRNLQREHLKRVQAVLTRSNPAIPADAVSLTRLHATELQAQLKAALARPGLSVENRAHLQESLGLVTEALRATMQRS
jgi:hypothetical protein